jgi:RNA-directed DNA polymerase
VRHCTDEAGERDPTDPAEGKPHQEQGAKESNTAGRPSPGTVSTKLQRIAKLARQMPGVALTSLSHHIDVEFLESAVIKTRRDGAVGVDKMTADDYGQNLRSNLESLLGRFKSGTYFAPPVRRVEIPKGDGKKTRPIGIPTYEDKILQRTVLMTLEAVYEQEFHDFSYGFRPGRSARQAVQHLRDSIMAMKGGWVLEVDITKFFDTLVYKHLRSFLDQRVCDGVLRRTIDKWLNAGVLVGGQVHHPELGTPQGGVISPLLANVYLHHVLDEWFVRDVKPVMRGEVHLVRYADDFVFVFEHESDARRILAVLPKRFGKYGLELHPEKTRLLPFRRPPYGGHRNSGNPSSSGESAETFDFLGFTFLWALTRRGTNAVFTYTARSRFRRAVTSIYQWLRRHRHSPLPEQYETICQKLRGHYAYFGLPGNSRRLSNLAFRVRRAWQKWLNRRSQRRGMPWERMNMLLDFAFPLP